MKYNAAQLLKSCGKINTVLDLINNLEDVLFLLYDDVERICKSKNLNFADFDYTFKESLSITIKTIKEKSKLKGVQRLLHCNNLEKATKWLIQRLIANMKNLAWNKDYKNNHKNLKVIEVEEYKIKSSLEKDKILDEIENEERIKELKKLDKDKLKQLLRMAWKKLKIDKEVDSIDFIDFCKKFNVDGKKIIEEEGDTKFGKEATREGHTQLTWLF